MPLPAPLAIPLPTTDILSYIFAAPRYDQNAPVRPSLPFPPSKYPSPNLTRLALHLRRLPLPLPLRLPR